MTKITQGARFIHKYSNEVGVIPTIPPNNDHTMDWFPTDIYKGEFYMNIADDRLFTRTDNGIIEIPMSVDLDTFANGTSVTITNTVGDDAIIGGATPTQAGLVTNESQSWNGEKTFNGNIIANERIRASFGTTISPTYSFSGAPSTGMYRPAANTLGFSVNGGERIRITQDIFKTYIRLGSVNINNFSNETTYITKSSTNTTGLDGAFLRLHNTSAIDSEGISSGIKFMMSSPTTSNHRPKGAIFFRKNNSGSNNRGDFHFALNNSNDRNTEVLLSDTKMILYDSGNLEVMNDMIVGNDLSVSNDIEVGGSGYFTGAIKIGDTLETDNGIIRYTGVDIEARIGGDWISLSQGGSGNIDLDVLTGTTTLTILNSGGDDAILEGATDSEAGLVTTGSQTWTGNKTFNGKIFLDDIDEDSTSHILYYDETTGEITYDTVITSVDLGATPTGTQITITNTAGTDAILWGADIGFAGLVTTGAQTWTGNKTFNGNISFTSTANRTISMENSTTQRMLSISGHVNTNSAGGVINIVGGTGETDGGDVNITGGEGKDSGGKVDIRGGNSLVEFGNVYIGVKGTNAIYLGGSTTLLTGTPGVNEVLYVDTSDEFRIRRGTVSTSVDLGENVSATLIEITNTAGTNAVIGGATDSLAGLVTTGSQTWTGIKTFNATPVFAENDADLTFTGTGNKTISTTTANTDLIIDPARNIRLMGRVGIDKAPSGTYALDVDGDSNFNGSIRTIIPIEYGLGIDIQDTATGPIIHYDNDTGSDNILELMQFVQMTDDSSLTVNGTSNFAGNVTISNATSTLHFSNSSGNKTISTGGNTHLILNPGGTGRVGINQTSPNHTLDVAGDINVSSVGVFRAAGFGGVSGEFFAFKDEFTSGIVEVTVTRGIITAIK